MPSQNCWEPSSPHEAKGPFQTRIQNSTSLCTADEPRRLIQHDCHSWVNISGTLFDDCWCHEKLWLELKLVRKCRQTSSLFPSNALMPVPHMKHRGSIAAPMWTQGFVLISRRLGCEFKSQDCHRATVEFLLSSYKSFRIWRNAFFFWENGSFCSIISAGKTITRLITFSYSTSVHQQLRSEKWRQISREQAAFLICFVLFWMITSCQYSPLISL